MILKIQKGVVSYGFWTHISMAFRLCMSEPYDTRWTNQVVPYGHYGPPEVLIFAQKNSGKFKFLIFWVQKCPFLGPYQAQMGQILTQELWEYKKTFRYLVQDVLRYFRIMGKKWALSQPILAQIVIIVYNLTTRWRLSWVVSKV